MLIFLNEIETKYNLKQKNINPNEGSQDSKSNTCPICLDNLNDIHVNPCGHMFCFACVKKFNDRRCPICRRNIVGILEHPEFKFSESVQSHQLINQQRNQAVNHANYAPRVNQNYRVIIGNRQVFHNQLNHNPQN